PILEASLASTSPNMLPEKHFNLTCLMKPHEQPQKYKESKLPLRAAQPLNNEMKSFAAVHSVQIRCASQLPELSKAAFTFVRSRNQSKVHGMAPSRLAQTFPLTLGALSQACLRSSTEEVLDPVKLTIDGKWKELENIILSEVTQNHKDKHGRDKHVLAPILLTLSCIRNLAFWYCFAVKGQRGKTSGLIQRTTAFQSEFNQYAELTVSNYCGRLFPTQPNLLLPVTGHTCPYLLLLF
ncbi:hypothetical protein STEG23_015991, partial [Scotinomys teguina]